MTEKELGKALLRLDAAGPAAPDPRVMTEHILARDRRRGRRRHWFTVGGWVMRGAVVGFPRGAVGVSAPGRRIVNFVPRPGSLSTSIVPPWASTIRFVVGRPNPLPPGLVVTNGRNTFAAWSAVMPMPVSIRSRRTPPFSPQAWM